LKTLKSFTEIINLYDVFLFDQWGVLHNGYDKFIKAEKCLQLLKELNKKVILISNSSNPTQHSINNLKKIGYSQSLYNYCITSGEIALKALQSDIYKIYGNKCYPLKLSKEKINIFNLKCTHNINKANFAMIADLSNNLNILDFVEDLDLMMKNNLPLFCSNPDYMVYDKKKLSMAGGTIAQLYEDMGGKVYRYGKPFKPIYENIIKNQNITKNKRVLVIGDSLWHDIAGGNEMGFDSLWIKNGVHKPQLLKKKEIDPLISKYKPKYAISDLKL